jgi:CheY-like chemotaxis protein
MPTKILAIDDSKTMRLAIKITFAAEDAEVIAVSKGSEAVPRAKKMGADLVIVDHTLAAGEPSGFDVVRALKSDPGTANIPVLLMLPGKGGVDESQVTACGADGSFAKPFDTQELIDLTAATISGGAVAKPAAAPRPAAAKPVAAPRPAAPPAAPPKIGAPPAAKPAVPPLGGARPAAPKPVVPAAKPMAPKPVAKPAAKPAVTPRPAARPPSGPTLSKPAPAGAIPIAIPIPFASASSPTPGMLKRLQEANGGAAAGLDPQAVSALLALSREVVEQVVWEVVPELAEAMIKEKSQQV